MEGILQYVSRVLLEYFQWGDGGEALFLHETPSPAPRGSSTLGLLRISGWKDVEEAGRGVWKVGYPQSFLTLCDLPKQKLSKSKNKLVPVLDVPAVVV